MGLLTVADLKSAMGGVTFTAAQTAVAEYLISRVSSYLETTTGVFFEPHVAETIRVKSDYRGTVRPDLYPITDVSNFHDFVTDEDITYPRWDGMGEFHGFFPNQVVDITLDYGMSSVPDDIQGVATEACKRGMAANPTNLMMKTVGDVIYQYGDMFAFSPADQQVINSYSVTESTVVTGPSRSPCSTSPLLLQMIPWANGPDWPDYEGWDCG